MRFGSLFAGIGGFDIGLERAGMECAWQVENNEFCNKVLAKHWPEVKRYGDIRGTGRHNLEPVDLICGGFPCQPFSVAGKRRGAEDDRHLWPEMLRVISELKPAWVLGENVPGIIPIFLDQAISDLEAKGYTCETFILPAVAFDAPHRRDRLWIVAYTEGFDARQLIKQSNNKHKRKIGEEKRGRFRNEFMGCSQDVPNTNDTRLAQRQSKQGNNGAQQSSAIRASGWPSEPRICRVVDGLSPILDRGARITTLGNAVVPQVVEHIGRMIMELAHDHPHV